MLSIFLPCLPCLLCHAPTPSPPAPHPPHPPHPQVSQSTLEALLEALYTRRLPLTDASVMPLLAASDQLQILRVKDCCVQVCTNLITWQQS